MTNAIIKTGMKYDYRASASGMIVVDERGSDVEMIPKGADCVRHIKAKIAEEIAYYRGCNLLEEGMD